jgi:hypothetical protein
MVISFRHGSDSPPKVVEEQPENALALGSGPAQALHRVAKDGAGGAAAVDVDRCWSACSAGLAVAPVGLLHILKSSIGPVSTCRPA